MKINDRLQESKEGVRNRVQDYINKTYQQRDICNFAISNKSFIFLPLATTRLQTSRRGIRRLGLGSLLQALTQIGVDAMEHLIGLFPHTRVGITQMPRDVLDEVILLTGLAAQDLPEAVGLDVVLVGDGVLLSDDGAGPFLVLLAGLDGLVL